jgi:hypothetical protein
MEVVMPGHTRRRTVVVIGCFVAIGVALRAADLFSGTWRANIEKSTYSPGPAPQSLTSTIVVMNDTFNLEFDGFDAENNPIIYEELSIKIDGKDYPVKSGDGNMMSMRKIDDYTLQHTYKLDGKVTTTTRTVYSTDGKTRTSTTTGVNSRGQKVNNVVFWERRQ